MELKQFYSEFETNQQLEAIPENQGTEALKTELKNQDSTGKKLMYLGEQQERVAKEIKTLDTMLQEVVSGVTDALSRLVDKFCNHEFGICVIKLHKSRIGPDGSLLDENGLPIEHYGIKQLENEQQRQRLLRDFILAKQYMPYLEMKEITSADGKTYALITGAGAKEFNAVIRAERAKRQLEHEAKFLAEEKKNLMQSMGLNTETPVVSHGSAETVMAAVSTPLNEKPVMEMA